MLCKITIENPMSGATPYYVQAVKEVHEFVSAQFTDVPGMPQDTTKMTIEVIREKIQVNGTYVDNPEFVSNSK